MPSLGEFSRFKILGKLPSMQINFSDAKYKAILRLLEVVVPHFEGRGDDAHDSLINYHRTVSPANNVSFSHSASFSEEPDYNLEDGEDETDSGRIQNSQEITSKETNGKVRYMTYWHRHT